MFGEAWEKTGGGRRGVGVESRARGACGGGGAGMWKRALLEEGVGGPRHSCGSGSPAHSATGAAGDGRAKGPN